MNSTNTGILTYSNNRAISAYGGFVGLEVYSPNAGISAFGGMVGIQAYSPNIAVSAYGGMVAVSATSPYIAIKASVPTKEQNSNGVRALDVYGFSFFEGDVTITGNLTAAGALTYLDTRVQITSSLYVKNAGTDIAATIIQQGSVDIMGVYDDDKPSLYVKDGGNVGIGTDSPATNLHVVDIRDDSDPEIRIQARTNNTYDPTLRLIGTGTTTDGLTVRYDSNVGDVYISNNVGGTAPTSNISYRVNTQGDTDSVVVFNTGNVGINATTPINAAKLNIVGDSSSSNIALSAAAPVLAASFSSPVMALSAAGVSIGAIIRSPNIALRVTGATEINNNSEESGVGHGVNINSNHGTGNVNIGNATGNLVLSGNNIDIRSANPVLINTVTGRVFNLNTSTGAAVNINTTTGGAFNLNSGTNATTNINTGGTNSTNTNIHTGGNTGVLTLGNSTGNTNIAASTLDATTASTVNINTTTGRALNVNSGTGATTNINTGTGTVTTTIGNAGTVDINGATLTLDSTSSASINNNASTATTNIGTGTTTGTISIGNNTATATTTILGATTNINGSTINVGTANTSTLSIGTLAGLATTIGNSTGNLIANSNNFTAPNQVVNVDSSVLTRSAGDTRYAPIVSSNTLGSANLTSSLNQNVVAGVALEANSTYEITAVAVLTVTASTGTQVAFVGDGTLTFGYTMLDEMSFSAAATTPNNTTYAGVPGTSTFITNTTQNTNPTAGTHYYRRRMTLRTGTAGTLLFRHAVVTVAGSNTSTPATGSFIVARKIQ